MKRTLFIAIVALAAACGGKKDKAPDPTPVAGSAAPAMGSAAPAMGSAAPAMGSAAPAAGSAAPAAGSAAPAAAAADKIEVPATADYEDKAKTEVTDKNVEQQLGALEKDLGN